MTNATAMLTALGDPTRQAILDLLTHGPLAVGELAGELPVSRPAVSQHLKVLKEVGLVVDRAEGTRRVYQVDPAGLAVLRAHLDGFWERSLAAFQAHAAADPPPAEPTPEKPHDPD
jgi:DNA-binding transcriptional ArsR family regulator